MKLKVAFILGLMLAATMTVAKSAHASTVILVDTTKPVSFLQSSLSEVSNLCGALPDGERVIVYRLGQGWQPVFDSELTKTTRINLGRALNSTYAVAGRPDWVTAVTTSVSAARGLASPTVYIFSHSWNNAKKKPPYQGTTLLDLLADKNLVPSEVRFVLRTYGGSPRKIQRENIMIVANSPNWESVVRERARAEPDLQSAPPPTAMPARPSGMSRLVYIGLAVGVTLLALIIVAIVRSNQLIDNETPKKAGDLALMARASPSDDSGAQEIVHRIACADHDCEEVNIKDGESVTVGDHYRARPLFTASGCYVTISQSGGVVEVENPTAEIVRIGQVNLARGQRNRVPLVYFEMSIGDKTRELRASKISSRYREAKRA